MQALSGADFQRWAACHGVGVHPCYPNSGCLSLRRPRQVPVRGTGAGVGGPHDGRRLRPANGAAGLDVQAAGVDGRFV